MDDDLGDLSEIMGDDYAHGYDGGDDDQGDPNIKPKRAPAPTENATGNTDSTLLIKFPPQKQFLTKLVAQAMPVVLIKDPSNPFANFGPPGGIEVSALGTDPKTATEARFTGLRAGTRYITRIVCTNPAGSSAGKPSSPMVTKPAEPTAPEFYHAKSTNIFIKFDQQSKGGMQEVTRLTIGVAKAGPSDPFAPENRPGEMSDSSVRCGELKQARIQKLQPGSLYVFRLIVHNQAGYSIGPVSKPMLTAPGVPSRLREDSRQRTSSVVSLKFEAHGQHLKNLELQYTQLTGVKATFDQLWKKNGKTVKIPNPQTATSCSAEGLEGNKKYVFRLVATNASGSSTGPVLGPIMTVEYAPEMLDKSGWMTEMKKKTKSGASFARRMSTRGPKNKKYWYVIDGRLLNWFTDTNCKEEVGFLHLSKLRRITYVPDADKQARQFTLILKTGDKITLECSSSDPNVTTHDYTISWMTAIQSALEVKADPNAGAKPEGRRSSIQAATEEELLEDEEEEEEAEDFDEDTGFEADAGFGGFDDEEEEGDGGFGAEEEEEEDEGEQFGDDFGGFGEEEDEGDDFGGFGGFDD
eukprot:m.315630 g.315630  ORF g.315630 m.315630 type:complete len:580 (+) comp20278_c0_seq1:131-1870(+)